MRTRGSETKAKEEDEQKASKKSEATMTTMRKKEPEVKIIEGNSNNNHKKRQKNEPVKEEASATTVVEQSHHKKEKLDAIIAPNGIVPQGGLVISEAKIEVEPKPRDVDSINHNISNRWWKEKRTEKSSMAVIKNMRKSKIGMAGPYASVWEKRTKEKERLMETKKLESELKEKKRLERLKEKERLQAKMKRKAENELKSSKYQVIKNPQKLKTMSKKQLRSIHKTRMGDDGVMRFVGAYE